MSQIFFKSKCGTLYNGDTREVLKDLPDNSIDCIITSPPYFSYRVYGEEYINKQIGVESSVEEYIENMLSITKELYRILKPTGVFFFNIDDCYAGSGMGTGKNIKKYKENAKESYVIPHGYNRLSSLRKTHLNKSMLMIPEQITIRMIYEQKWILRNKIVWAKKVVNWKDEEMYGNGMPSSVKDRYNHNWEYLYFFVKDAKKYHYNKPLIPYKKPLNRWGGERIKPDGSSIWDENTDQSTYRDRVLRPNPKGAGASDVWQIQHVQEAEPLLKCAKETVLNGWV